MFANFIYVERRKIRDGSTNKYWIHEQEIDIDIKTANVKIWSMSWHKNGKDEEKAITGGLVGSYSLAFVILFVLLRRRNIFSSNLVSQYLCKNLECGWAFFSSIHPCYKE